MTETMKEWEKRPVGDKQNNAQDKIRKIISSTHYVTCSEIYYNKEQKAIQKCNKIPIKVKLK